MSKFEGDALHLMKFTVEQIGSNHRQGMSDVDRFDAALSRIVRKRLAYAKLMNGEKKKPVDEAF